MNQGNNNNQNNSQGNNSPAQLTTTSARGGTSTSSPHWGTTSTHSSGLAGRYVAAVVVCVVIGFLATIAVLLLCYFRRRRRIADKALADRAAEGPAPLPGSTAAYFHARGRANSRALAEQRQPSADMTGQVLPDGTLVGSDAWLSQMELGTVPAMERPAMVERGSMTTPFDRQLRSQGDAGMRGAVEGGGVHQEEAPIQDGEILPSYQQATVGRRTRALRLPR